MIDQEKICKQCFSDNPAERIEALIQLRDNYSLLSEKERIWGDLYRLISDEFTYVRWSAVESLGAVFQYVPDKQKAWNELIKLTNSEDLHIRDMAASVIGSAFSQVPDKYQAWNDLHELTGDQDDLVRFFAPKAICCAFPHIPDKQQAWDDLIELSNDVSIDVEYNAANALGSVFSQMLDKQQAWDDLIKLVTGEDGYFGLYAYHTLGKISIFNASQVKTEEDYKKELEKAIVFFEKEVQVLSSDLDLCSIDNPSEFCLPFYRSFHAIVFKKHEAKEEVGKYLAEAKDAVRGSKSKELLFEAVESLANALKEVQNMENMDLRKIQGELDFYRKYCDRAAELMKDTEKTAPFATIAMRKGLPILDRNLKELLEEIQKKTEVIREQTKGTPFEKLGDELDKDSLSLLQVRDLVGFKKQFQNLENKLVLMCSKLPEGQKGEACESLKTIHEEHSIEDKIPLINDILSKLSYQLDMISCLNRIDESLSSVNNKIEELIIISRPGISEEVVISTGFQLAGSGFQHSVTIPLQEISYSELKEDLEKITGIKIDKLSKVPRRLANKIKGYLLLHDKEDVLEKLI